MGNNKMSKEDLKKLEELENEAYLELCQIIAEAVQVQDITLLDARIASWKNKYKKLLDSSSSASIKFRKKIEFLLNQYYSEITQYILKQIRKTENKRIENQSKALKKLYNIIKETDDLSLLKKKVKEWESKYPISGFLNMYQKKIKYYTSEKHLKENAFDQEQAFHDLYYITKLNRTYDEFKKEISNWEDKYSIHNKFELDDFIKHESEVKRYSSDEYLKSIAREDPKDLVENAEKQATEDTSSLSTQASAYSTLLAIARKPDNIDAVFDWVYKNNSIKFNDKYKELILSATYLDFSPKYLNYLSIPDINIGTNLSFDEFKNMNEIKKYAIISYFNLLLPPEKSVANNNFNKHINAIYRLSRQARFTKENYADNINFKTITPLQEIDKEEIEKPTEEIILNEPLTQEEEIVENVSTELTISADENMPQENVLVKEEKPIKTVDMVVDKGENSGAFEVTFSSVENIPEEITLIENEPSAKTLDIVIAEEEKLTKNDVSEITISVVENLPAESTSSKDEISVEESTMVIDSQKEQAEDEVKEATVSVVQNISQPNIQSDIEIDSKPIPETASLKNESAESEIEEVTVSVVQNISQPSIQPDIEIDSKPIPETASLKNESAESEIEEVTVSVVQNISQPSIQPDIEIDSKPIPETASLKNESSESEIEEVTVSVVQNVSQPSIQLDSKTDSKEPTIIISSDKKIVETDVSKAIPTKAPKITKKTEQQSVEAKVSEPTLLSNEPSPQEIVADELDETSSSSQIESNENEELEYNDIIGLSPFFFEMIHLKDEKQKKQVAIISSIDETTNKYMALEDRTYDIDSRNNIN